MVIERFLETLGVDRLCIYMHGAGVPMGMRICTRHPNWIEGLVIQNGNCYEDGFTDATKPWFNLWRDRNPETEEAVRRFTTREGIVWQYVDGVRDRERISPDAWNMDCACSGGGTIRSSAFRARWPISAISGTLSSICSIAATSPWKTAAMRSDNT